MLNKNYNSNREHLVLPEYGRHIYKIVKALCEIEDDERRNIESKRVIDIMGNINPGLRDSPMFRHKLWDHLFIMSDFKLNIDSPYPKPTREALVLKPRRLEYPKSVLHINNTEIISVRFLINLKMWLTMTIMFRLLLQTSPVS